MNFKIRHLHKFLKCNVFKGQNGCSSGFTVHFAGIGWFTEDLLFIFGKIFIYPQKPGSVAAFNGDKVLKVMLIDCSLLQNQNISDYFRSDFSKGIIGQTDRRQQCGSGSKIASGIDTFGVHCRRRGKQNSNTSRFQSIQCSGNTIIMQIVSHIIRVMRTDLIKGNIADNQIKRLFFDVSFGKVIDNDFTFRVKLLQDPSGNTVDFNGSKLSLDIFRHQTDKVSHSGTELPELASGYAGFCGNFPHKFNEATGSIMAVQCGCSCRNVLF